MVFVYFRESYCGFVNPELDKFAYDQGDQAEEKPQGTLSTFLLFYDVSFNLMCIHFLKGN